MLSVSNNLCVVDTQRVEFTVHRTDTAPSHILLISFKIKILISTVVIGKFPLRFPLLNELLLIITAYYVGQF